MKSTKIIAASLIAYAAMLATTAQAVVFVSDSSMEIAIPYHGDKQDSASNQVAPAVLDASTSIQ